MIDGNFEIIGEGEVIVGRNSRVASSVKFIFHKPGKITIGDYCTIGNDVKFIIDGGPVEIDDWTSLHDNCLVLSTEGVKIGQHGWFGQNTVLDGSGGLTIGNGVRVGMYSQIWSHVAAGEQIEGCTLYGYRPVVIEDNVWLVGSCICASGVTIGRRTVALIGSNITKSWPADIVIAGAPATYREKLSFYTDVSLDDKWSMLNDWLQEASDLLDIEQVDTQIPNLQAYRMSKHSDKELVVFAKDGKAQSAAIAKYPEATICDLEHKVYGKKYTKSEQTILKYLAGNKARFLKI